MYNGGLGKLILRFKEAQTAEEELVCLKRIDTFLTEQCTYQEKLKLQSLISSYSLGHLVQKNAIVYYLENLLSCRLA